MNWLKAPWGVPIKTGRTRPARVRWGSWTRSPASFLSAAFGNEIDGSLAFGYLDHLVEQVWVAPAPSRV